MRGAAQGKRVAAPIGTTVTRQIYTACFAMRMARILQLQLAGSSPMDAYLRTVSGSWWPRTCECCALGLRKPEVKPGGRRPLCWLCGLTIIKFHCYARCGFARTSLTGNGSS